MCADTQMLRTSNGIEDQVIYLTGNPSTHPASNESDDDEEEDLWQHVREMKKDDLISSVIHLQKEVTKCNTIIQSLRLQRGWIIDKKPQLLEILELINTLRCTRS